MTSEPPRITFPCEYPIKVLGDAHEDFETTVLEVVQRHDTSFTRAQLSARASRQGAYVSVTLQLTASSENQIKALFQDLKALDFVRLVL